MRRYWQAFVDGLWWRRKTAPTASEITERVYMLTIIVVLVLWLDWPGLAAAFVVCTLVPLYAGFRSAWITEKAQRPLLLDFSDDLDTTGDPWPEPRMSLPEALRAMSDPGDES